ncbi:hypothetical protein GQ55_2G366900 [Panicum hallii var. hallii]|uniref:Uncharacterized protein n=1 Tax=Panicum hallii var. hallii TaxID=1504633 RepID=A0A2T7EWB9_9POAL|nr:hypothetical protein GQ55_2G366900 [Panicum hallii var. hallii]
MPARSSASSRWSTTASLIWRSATWSPCARSSSGCRRRTRHTSTRRTAAGPTGSSPAAPTTPAASSTGGTASTSPAPSPSATARSDGRASPRGSGSSSRSSRRRREAQGWSCCASCATAWGFAPDTSRATSAAATWSSASTTTHRAPTRARRSACRRTATGTSSPCSSRAWSSPCPMPWSSTSASSSRL